MRKKFYLFAFILCIFACGVVLSACNNSPALSFKENASLSKVYDGKAISTADVNEIITVADDQEVTITFFQGETEVANPTNVGNYKVAISIPSKTIEKEFEITPKQLIGNPIFSLVTPWQNKEGARTWDRELTTDNGLIEGDEVGLNISYESHDANSTRTLTLTGTDADNYSIAENQVVIRIGIKLTLTDGNGNNLTAYAFYGENVLYNSVIEKQMTELSQTHFESKFGAEVESIKTSGGVSLTKDGSLSQLRPNIAGITDENGNWIVPNGKDSTLTTFTVNLATAE